MANQKTRNTDTAVKPEEINENFCEEKQTKIDRKLYVPPAFESFVDVLGTPYKIIIRGWDDDPYFKEHNADGYCDGVTKLICLCSPATTPGWENETVEFYDICMKETLRHEITHAFFHESGLASCCLAPPKPWAKNEEMIDWIALQGPKIYKAWEDAGALVNIANKRHAEWAKYKDMINQAKEQLKNAKEA